MEAPLRKGMNVCGIFVYIIDPKKCWRDDVITVAPESVTFALCLVSK